MMAGVLGWLEEPSSSHGLRFAEDDGVGWEFWSYERLAALSLATAAHLRASGVDPGDVVLIGCPTSPRFIGAFFGALLAGATPSVTALPTAFDDPSVYRRHFDHLLDLTGARAVVTVPQLAPFVRETLEAHGCALLFDLPETPPAGFTPAPPPQTAVVQFSSGSSGPPRAVRIGMSAVSANVGAIGEWLGFDAERDRCATWLPLHHDMGLVGSLLFPMSNAADLWLMRPEQFIGRPLRWLRTVSEFGVTTAATPMFALGHVLRRVRPEDVEKLDLARWRTLIVGAERVDAAVLDAFADLLAPAGFDAGAFLPAYGLAEATLAVTGRRHAEPLRTMTVDVGSLAPGSPVRSAVGDARTTTFVGCGRPLAGTEATVVDDDGRRVADGVLGEIVVRGPGVADGYLDKPYTVSEPFGGVLHTGDAGFRMDGELFVVGRLGDSVKQFGQWVFAEDVERVALSVSARPSRTTCLLGHLDGHNTAVVVVEEATAEHAEVIGQALRRHGFELRVLVLSAPSRWISRTTSGKPKRRAMWRRLLEHREETVVCWDSAAQGLSR
ncbi:AMP-binding protein [Streptomyces sp. S.PNR 29]|uniref:AMP-binding protein n=1 Tax=Streptomyces sp. S.PNR 29 TaxID=2973805 RepID=UPI0025B106BF|nr:AMP-binding protein [Streptomyces sp. S.PNR 29]MDN0201107.1 AMP-binding protein [Streptomyces sp. S.PNR 29]